MSLLSRFSLRKTLAGLCLAATASLLPLAASALETMKIGTVVWAGYGPFYVADALDLYKKHGLKVNLQFFNDPAMIPSAMAGGALDGGMLTYDQVINSAAKGLKHQVVMPIDFSNGGDAIVADKSVNSVADFKGKKVGFNPLSPSDFLLAYALKSNGLSDKDISPVNMTPEGIPGAKFHVVYSSKDAPGLITDVLVFDQKVIARKQAAIKAMIQGYVDGLAYMQSHPDDAAKIIGKVLGVDAEEAKAQMSGVYNIPLGEMHKNFEKADATTSFFGSGAVIAQLLKDNGQIPAIPDFAQTFDAQFVQALAK
jgi:NitT/TauT family transport system substrate-binding protein